MVIFIFFWKNQF